MRRRMIGAVLALLLLSQLSCAVLPAPAETRAAPLNLPGGQPSLQRARSVLGSPASGASWFSGVWAAGATIDSSRVAAFGKWRGAPADAATTYPEYDRWQDLHDSVWHITTFRGFPGVLVYGLPMLPTNGSGGLRSIVTGEHDWVYRKVAQDLARHGRGRSIVRIGWEANGDWQPWQATADTASDFVAAYRHIAAVLRSVTPDLVIDFDLACGTKMAGQRDRMDALTLLYPGDDAVDIVGCDTYDWYDTKTTDQASWELTKRPRDAVGIQDVADFARARGKGFSVPEWGLASTAAGGVGDNPYFIEQMRGFFQSNRDILVLESYFNEPMGDIANSLWDPTQNPRSAETYRRLW